MADITVRPRYGGSKTRSGCVTCKARRVKCDERKPHCLRCEKAGRTCEGYRAPSPRNHRGQLTIISYVPAPYGRLSAQPDRLPQEQRALSFFQHRTAPEIAGSFSAELWSKFILLVAHHHNSVKHALIALGSVHEHFVNSKYPIQQPASEYALLHYGKAIQGVLTTRNAKTEDAVEIALVSCILFACMESLRGHYQSAMTHMLSGMKVIEEEQISNPNSHHAYIPRAILRSLFVRMNSQIMNVGGFFGASAISLVRTSQVSIPKCYSSTDEALDDIENIYNLTAHVMYQAERVAMNPHASPATLDDFKDDALCLEVLRLRWQEAFKAMLLSDVAGHQPRDPPCLILNIYNNVLRIVLNVDFIDPDSDFDHFNDVFRGIVDDAEEHISKTSVVSPFVPSAPRSVSPSDHPYSSSSTPADSSNTTGPMLFQVSPAPQSAESTPSPPIAPRPSRVMAPTFSLSMGVVAALYLSAARCRSAPIRHKALALLKSCNRREGFWDSRLAASLAEGLIAIEEANMQDSPDQQINAGNSDQVIPAHMRVKTVHVEFGAETSGKAAYSFLNSIDAYTQQRDKSSNAKPFKDLMEW